MLIQGKRDVYDNYAGRIYLLNNKLLMLDLLIESVQMV